MDVCSTCTATALTLDAATFAALGGSSAEGGMSIMYRPVECRPPAGTNITVTVSDYRASDGGWLRLMLSNVVGGSGIQSVEARQTPLAVRGAAGAGGLLNVQAAGYCCAHIRPTFVLVCCLW